MGYNTYFTLTVRDNKMKILDGDTQDFHYNNVISEYTDTNGQKVELLPLADSDTRWESHDKDMIAHSKKYPDLIFELFGEGDDSEDFWIKYYHNGKSQYCQGTRVFEEYDPDNFVEPSVICIN